MSFTLKAFGLTGLAMLAFAGNSVLGRLALENGAIDPASFSIIRLMSAAVMLYFLIAVKKPSNVRLAYGSWRSAVMLFLYVVTFSYAYVGLDTGTGALILFGSVQITMIGFNVFQGNKLSLIEQVGLLLAFSGLLVLLLPGSTQPSFLGFLLMLISGVAWGLYSVWGKGSLQPLADTAGNFLKTVPMCALLGLVLLSHYAISAEGVYLALASGALTSGVGYAIWYAVLPALSITKAAVSQLSVPIIAALGGVMFAAEHVTVQLFLASLLTLGGVCIVILKKHDIQ